MKCSLGISNFLEEMFPILLFCSISLLWLRKAFLPLLAILWNSVFRWVYLSFFLLPVASLLFSAICKASTDNHFAFLHFFSWGWFWFWYNVTGLLPIVLQAVCLSDLISWTYLSLLQYNHKGFDLYLNGLVVFHTFFNLSLNFGIRSSWSEPQLVPGLVFAHCVEHLPISKDKGEATRR